MCDFLVFPKLKIPFKASHFEPLEDGQSSVKTVLKVLCETDFQQCFKAWQRRIKSEFEYCECEQPYYRLATVHGIRLIIVRFRNLGSYIIVFRSNSRWECQENYVKWPCYCWVNNKFSCCPLRCNYVNCIAVTKAFNKHCIICLWTRSVHFWGKRHVGTQREGKVGWSQLTTRSSTVFLATLGVMFHACCSDMPPKSKIQMPPRIWALCSSTASSSTTTVALNSSSTE